MRIRCRQDLPGCTSYYPDDKKLKKYALFKNAVDNTITLVYYSTSTAIQKSWTTYKEEVCDGI